MTAESVRSAHTHTHTHTGQTWTDSQAASVCLSLNKWSHGVSLCIQTAHMHTQTHTDPTTTLAYLRVCLNRGDLPPYPDLQVLPTALLCTRL